MGFHSFTFLYLFLPVSLAAFGLVRLIFRKQAQTAAKLLILVLSLLFYLWYEPVYFLPVTALVLLNYWAVRRILTGGNRSVFRILLVIDLLVLVVFKFVERGLIQDQGWFRFPDILSGWMPLGISFLIFTLLAYLIDANKQRIPADHNALDVLVHQLFFGKVISGPITRFGQFYKTFEDRPGTAQFANGIRRFIVGFAKKVLIADSLAPTVNQIFALGADERSLAHAWFGVLLYTLQIYYDFSGYTDMAIGLGTVFGLDLPENFDHPYVAKSIREFWRRWHITLSNWFRDYRFFPLERSTRKFSRYPRFLNVWIVFILTGFWHGFTLNFLIWGLIHGVAISLENGAWGRLLVKLPGVVQTMYAFGVVMFSWVFFRAETLEDAGRYLGSLVNFSMPTSALPVSQFTPVEAVSWIAIIVGIIFTTQVPGWLFEKIKAAFSVREDSQRSGFSMGVFAQDLILLAVFFLSVIVTTGRSYVSFLYGSF